MVQDETVRLLDEEISPGQDYDLCLERRAGDSIGKKWLRWWKVDSGVRPVMIVSD